MKYVFYSVKPFQNFIQLECAYGAGWNCSVCGWNQVCITEETGSEIQTELILETARKIFSFINTEMCNTKEYLKGHKRDLIIKK